MPDSPLFSSSDTLTYNILINGQPIKASYLVLSIELERAVFRIPTAKIILGAQSVDTENNQHFASESNDFIPGVDIEIKLGYGSNNETLFHGMIVKQGIRNLTGLSNELIIHCRDKSTKMTLGRKSAYYQDMTDSAITASILSDYGLSSAVEATTCTHKQLVKYQLNDWDFIVGRAEANGMLAYAENGKVSVKKPLASGMADLKVAFGKDVLSYDCSIESPFIEKNELNALADVQQTRDRMFMMQGTITFIGNATPKLNTLLEMNGFGDRFNGNALITSIQDSVREGIWRTTVGIGLPSEWKDEQRALSAPSTGGLLPAISGLQNGIVKKIDEDPDGQYRILVEVPVIAPAGAGIWARMAHFYATSGKGNFFLPEIGDEVVLGFLNDDPRYPIILGMLYSSNIQPPYPPDHKNEIKAFVTKNDLKIEFNDGDKVLTIKTPGGNEFVLSDKDKSITLKDQNGNTIEMTDAGIALNSATDILLKANGKIEVQATTDIAVRATGGDISLEGLNVQAKAEIAFSAEGSASAEIKAAGTTTVQGAMVMIN
jgi:uncharacterized protein involved in type VI secretion and phage assembly